MKSGFTAEEDARIRVLVAQQKTSREIAAELGRTRNSIIGRCFRMGLKLQPIGKHGFFKDADMIPRREKKIKIAAPKPVAAPVFKLEQVEAHKPVEIVIISKPIGLFDDDIRREHCRWVLQGEGISTIVCGGTVQDGSSYCAGHHRLCYRKPEYKKKKRIFSMRLRRMVAA